MYGQYIAVVLTTAGFITILDFIPQTEVDMLQDVMAKKKISMRLEEADLKLLETVSSLKDTLFYKKDRTELITDAIRKVYLPVVNPTESKEEKS